MSKMGSLMCSLVVQLASCGLRDERFRAVVSYKSPRELFVNVGQYVASTRHMRLIYAAVMLHVRGLGLEMVTRGFAI